MFHEVYRNEITQASAEIAVITFGSLVNVIQPFKNITKEDTNTLTLKPAGVTKMKEAVEKGLDMLERRKNKYRDVGIASYKPWLVIMTDGEPTDEHGRPLRDKDLLDVHSQLKRMTEDRELVIFAIGIGENVNMNRLQVFSPNRIVQTQRYKV